MSHACHVALSASDPAAGHHHPTPLPETPGHSQANVAQSLVGSLILSPGSQCIQGFLCPFQESVSPFLCKFWRLYCGVNGDLLQEVLCHTQVCCTQSPCPFSRLLLTHTSTETLKHSFGSVSVGSLGPGVDKVCLSPLCLTPCQISRTSIVLGTQKMIFMEW